MTLRAAIATDAYTVFTSTDDFAEEVKYLPRLGEARTINAVVIRDPIGSADVDGIVRPVWQVHVANDSNYGISSVELDTGGDQIQLPPRDGEEKKIKTITHVLIQDHGMLVLQVE